MGSFINMDLYYNHVTNSSDAKVTIFSRDEINGGKLVAMAN